MLCRTSVVLFAYHSRLTQKEMRRASVSREVKGNIKVDNGEAVCGDRRWMEVSQEHVKYRVFISGVEPSVSPA